MPEHAEIEVLRRGYETFEREGIDGIMPFLDRDIEWRNPADSPIAGVFHGHDGVREWYAPPPRRRSRSCGSFPTRCGRWAMAGSSSCRGCRSVGWAARSTCRSRSPHIWRIRNGLATHLQMYSDPSEALEAGEDAPLPEDPAGL